MANLDAIEVKFSVLGGNKLAGDSGHDILNDLQTICSNISRSKLLKVSVHLDNKTKFGGLTEEIQKSIKLDNLKLNTEKVKLKFGVDTKHLTELLNQFFKDYHIPEGAGSGSSSEKSGGKSGSTSRKEKSPSSSSLVSKYTAALREELRLRKELKKEINNGASGGTLKAISAQIVLQRNKVSEIQAEIAAIEDVEQRTNALNATAQSRKELLGKQKITLEQIADAEAKRQAKADASAKKEKEKVDRQKELNNLYQEAATYMDQMGKAIKDKSPELYTELSDYMKELRSGDFSGSQADAEAFFNAIKKRAADAGITVESLGDKIKGVFSDKYMYAFLMQIASKGKEIFDQLLNNVIEIDTAMTELKKVTTETDATYERFLTKACTRSKELGALVSDVVTATADFARLGYGISDASTLADAAIVYKNVGDGITDISTASESIISTMQAFGVEATDVMTIVDKFNNVGKFCLAT